METFSLQWQTPLWLIFLAAPWLLQRWRKRHFVQKSLLQFADQKLWPWLTTDYTVVKKSSPSIWIAAWSLGIIALAGPFVMTNQDTSTVRTGVDIVVIVDISPSMQVTDTPPSRLARSKLELSDFIQTLKGDRIALITFSANAYPVLPLTFDYNTFLYFTNALEPSLVTKKGSNLGQALIEAEKLLNQGGKNGRAIILLSDGEIHNQAALEVGQNNQQSPLFILGMGTQSGGPIPDQSGRFIRQNQELVISRLQPEKLLSLTQPENYISLKNDDSDWQTLMKNLRQQTETNYYPTQVMTNKIELFPWLLSISLLLFLYQGMRRFNSILPLILLPVLSATPNPSHANVWQEQQAHSALENGNYPQAIQYYQTIGTYNGYMGLGAAYYRQQKWQESIHAYQQAFELADTNDQRAHSSFNEANALAKQQQFEKAQTAYQRALHWKKNYKEAILNLNLIKTLLPLRGNSNKETQPSPQNRLAETGSIDPTLIGEEEMAQQERLTKAEQQMNALNAPPNPLLKYRFLEHDKQSMTTSKENPW
ncbi:MAG: VWA domain-containing protein [Gammaproteobacteria bacterium]|nr:VWA domain-containing protein [Gammaproteobacteria bacterium]